MAHGGSHAGSHAGSHGGSHAGSPRGAAEPLSAARMRAALSGQGALWTDIRVVAETGSTNEDALKQAVDGAREGLVIAADYQSAGRGRQGRRWLTSPGAALTFSVLLRPQPAPQAARGWIPLLAGVAVTAGVRRATGVDARLKWPNDVLASGGKLAGILAEQSGEAIVVGVGVNVLGGEADLPVATATSLERCGAARVDRTALLAAILAEFGRRYLRWRETGPGNAAESGLQAEYRALCDTLGRQVRVQLPGDRELAGLAVDVDPIGQLLVSRPDGELASVSAGDVIHVR
jgi:BirA family transcriptional regulator, biotin operon repressor / biotin---[acetyl-CoA-carboxylase] ligase